eukprot:scaffold21907_cov57-Phaeocystis_antarctica.AAC.11
MDEFVMNRWSCEGQHAFASPVRGTARLSCVIRCAAAASLSRTFLGKVEPTSDMLPRAAHTRVVSLCDDGTGNASVAGKGRQSGRHRANNTYLTSKPLPRGCVSGATPNARARSMQRSTHRRRPPTRPTSASGPQASRLVVGELLDERLLLQLHARQRVVLCAQSLELRLLLVDHGLQLQLLPLAHLALRIHAVTEADGLELLRLDNLACGGCWGWAPG